jgi:hypothetical protein
MSDGSNGDDRRQFNLLLTSADRRRLEYIIYKYRCRHFSTAIRVCIRMVAAHLGYKPENDKPDGPVIPPIPPVDPVDYSAQGRRE